MGCGVKWVAHSRTTLDVDENARTDDEMISSRPGPPHLFQVGAGHKSPNPPMVYVWGGVLGFVTGPDLKEVGREEAISSRVFVLWSRSGGFWDL